MIRNNRDTKVIVKASWVPFYNDLQVAWEPIGETGEAFGGLHQDVRLGDARIRWTDSW
jgi:hypothetical protein